MIFKLQDYATRISLQIAIFFSKTAACIAGFESECQSSLG
jgi:hypothetical protein